MCLGLLRRTDGDLDPLAMPLCREYHHEFEYPVIITECTFLDDTELERADRIGRTVWSRLRPVVEAHPQTLFVLTHFSLRHSDQQVLAFFRQQWEQASRPDNVLLWVHPDSHLPEQHQHRTP
jgi:ribonuclease Z